MHNPQFRMKNERETFLFKRKSFFLGEYQLFLDINIFYTKKIGYKPKIALFTVSKRGNFSLYEDFIIE